MTHNYMLFSNYNNVVNQPTGPVNVDTLGIAIVNVGGIALKGRTIAN